MLWAITSYFNSAGFHNRLRNYRIFRENLAVPLVAVEFSHEGKFDLGASDAEILLQIAGGDVMWQKERLLNLALASLPSDCTHVAWIDCDVTFADGDWPALAVQAMEQYPLIHLFGHAYMLRPGEENAAPPLPSSSEIESFMRKMEYEGSSSSVLSTGSCSMADRCSLGFAWAARRELLDRHQFYDACILGGGDRMLLCAALGQYEAGIIRVYMNSQQARHFVAWGRSFHEAVQGRVGFIDRNIFHLWHGELENRRYLERHRGFSSFNFDPLRDIAIDGNGAWRWNGPKTEMHRYVRSYFASRREDG